MTATLTGEGGVPLAPPLDTPCASLPCASSPPSTAAAWPPGGALLAFPLAVCDLPPDAVLTLRLAALTPAGGATLLAAGAQPLFSGRGRLKAGPRTVRLVAVGKGGGRGAAGGASPRRHLPPPTASAAAAAARARALDLRARRLARGELGTLPWLDALSSAALADARAGRRGALAAAAPPAGPTALVATLHLTLPAWPQAVLYHPSPGGGGGGGGGAGSGSGRAGTAGGWWPGGVPAGTGPTTATPAIPPAPPPPPSTSTARLLRPLYDPETGLDSPAELKGQRMARAAAARASARARGAGGGGGDEAAARAARPDAAERAALDALLAAPPGRPLSAQDRALVWRLRWALAPDPGALPLVLRAADMPGDAAGAAGVGVLLAGWAPVRGAAGALGLLAPELAGVPGARGHAAAALAGSTDEELELCMLVRGSEERGAG